MLEVIRSPYSFAHHQSGLRSSAVLVVATVLALSVPAAAPPSSAAIDPSCPAAADLSTLAPGAPLHGLTVNVGSTPEAFTGTLIGVQKDAIVPGVDLVIVQLSSAAITAAGGVWEGMSGSPVYAANDDLVGAVSWSLSYGPSDIVGVTPAAAMQEMLDGVTPAGVKLTPPKHISLTPKMQRAIVGTGSADLTAAQAGMRPLTLPLAVSGLSTYRIDQMTAATSMSDVRPFSASSVPTEQVSDDPIVVGGNLAASIAYGFLSAVAVGTATEVCGDEVLGFGHPIMDIPKGDLTMHNADVLYVQPDSLGKPFKVANISGPIGWLPDNLLAGVHGDMGSAPAATEVDSTTTVGTDPPQTGTTYISLRPFVPTFTAYSVIAVEDLALGLNMSSWFGTPGTDLVTWTIDGTRGDGSPFTYTRTDRYADKTDIAYTWPWDLHEELNQLMNNRTETVNVTNVTTATQTTTVYRHLEIVGLETKVDGVWVPVAKHDVLLVHAGGTTKIRVVMQSAVLGTRYKKVRIELPARASGQSGYLTLNGGNDYYNSARGKWTVDRMIAYFETAPRHDQIDMKMTLDGMRGVKGTFLRAATVGGNFGVSVQAIG